MLKVNNKNTRTHKLWNYFTPFSSVSIVDVEQINISWDFSCLSYTISNQEYLFKRTIILSVCKLYSKLTTQKMYFNFQVVNMHCGNTSSKSIIKTLVQRLFSSWNPYSWLWIRISPSRFKLPTWEIVSSIF